jgi:hypothetical protein
MQGHWEAKDAVGILAEMQQFAAFAVRAAPCSCHHSWQRYMWHIQRVGPNLIQLFLFDQLLLPPFLQHPFLPSPPRVGGP